ncbi:hypothetical protein [Streptomyces sp. t39]|uniref:hypothetical protein n=1 Tax=Streptomyces sp. t39 TaxID=1828156 RepID=UPI0011CE40E0|nr:hypothetical protein [Streptomyces sp. t39]TXS44004.1 hypothetical protein EAO77_35085 [Streptomyces sp. t39]
MGIGHTRRFTEAWYWRHLLSVAAHRLRSRTVWPVLGNAGTVLVALTALLHHWSRPLPPGAWAVVQLACLVCQAVALIPVVRPGAAATPRDVTAVLDRHQTVTVATVCGTWVLGVPPGLALLRFFDVEAGSRRWAAVFLSGTALTLACIAGLITATAVSATVRRRCRASGAPGWEDPGDGADAGGSDGD